MSEEILKALMQLFAIITKQDGGVTQPEKDYVKLFLRLQMDEKSVDNYYQLYERFLSEAEDNIKGKTNVLHKKKSLKRKQIDELKKTDIVGDAERISVKDSVRTLTICKKINTTLSQKQKAVVLIRLFELIRKDKKISSFRNQIIETVSDVFNIENEALRSIRDFVLSDNHENIDHDNILIVNGDKPTELKNAKHTYSKHMEGTVYLLKIISVDLYFIRYVGNEEVSLNGLLIDKNRIYLFASGSVLRLTKGMPIYYSDVSSRFLEKTDISSISLNVNDVFYSFPNGNIGLQGIDLSEREGNLIGILGDSGTGKTTLLNVLSGQLKPSKGQVKLNDIDIYEDKKKIEGFFGFVSQVDLLFEDLTVYQNMLYNAQFCFADKSAQEITELVKKILLSLSLWNVKDLKVGSSLNKTISGGERKRLNIGLELIREPPVLFVDEPTSGLSSRDSENVMDLLRELALAGKLVFVVIHQPSSDIYKMFDRVYFLDEKGYPIFYGNPVESVTYFKTIDEQINSEQGECVTCGNVHLELIFNIIDSKVVDEYGQYTEKRKITPGRWNEYFLEEQKKNKRKEVVKDHLESNLKIPNILKQLSIFIKRDVFSKLSNKQYLLVNLLEAPVLALVLSFVIRYIDSHQEGYIYCKNDNIPAYIFICIIVGLFIGLSVSAEEIVKDRKLLKREKFLNLSKFGYFSSKVVILFFISAIQTVSFVLIGNLILEVQDAFLDYWVILFSISCFANMLGLNISSSFNSAVTIYILIPLLLIPQLILSGAIFSFDKLNDYVGSDEKVPIIADLMVSRWGFEAIVVDQFVNNEFEKNFYDYEKKESFAGFRQAYLFPELKKKVDFCKEYTYVDNVDDINNVEGFLKTLRENAADFSDQDELYYEHVTVETLNKLNEHFGTKEIMNKQFMVCLDSCFEYILVEDPRILKHLKSNINIIKNTLKKEVKYVSHIEFDKLNEIVHDKIGWDRLLELDNLINDLMTYHSKEFKTVNKKLNDLKYAVENENQEIFLASKNSSYNDELARLVKNSLAKKRIKEQNGSLIQQIDPIYKDPVPENAVDYRTQFFSPVKYFMGFKISTYLFNLIVIWAFSFLLFLTLYFDILKNTILFFSKEKQ